MMKLSCPRLVALLLIPILTTACGSETTPPGSGGDLSVVIERAGTGSDADGLTVTLRNTATAATQTQTASLGETLTWASLPAGDYTLSASDLALQCVAEPLNVTIESATVEEELAVDCVGQFAYMRWYDNTRSDVYYLDEHGVDHLLSQGGFDIARDWSADGQYLLVERWIEDRCETYRVDLEGNAQRLLDDDVSTAGGQWSPTGDLIAVQYGPCAGEITTLNIVLFDAETLAPVDTVPGTVDEHPVWSPDGSEVAFMRVPDRLLVYTLGTQTLGELAAFGRASAFPRWSPDGEHVAAIVFDPQQVAVVERATAMAQVITGDSIVAVGGSLAWFPNGRTIAFGGVRGTDEAVYTVNVDDRLTRLFTNEITTGFSPNVSAESQVLFVARTAGRNEIYVGESDGSGVRKIVSEDQHLLGPLWRSTVGGSAAVSSMPSAFVVRAVPGGEWTVRRYVPQ